MGSLEEPSREKLTDCHEKLKSFGCKMIWEILRVFQENHASACTLRSLDACDFETIDLQCERSRTGHTGESGKTLDYPGLSSHRIASVNQDTPFPAKPWSNRGEILADNRLYKKKKVPMLSKKNKFQQKLKKPDLSL